MHNSKKHKYFVINLWQDWMTKVESFFLNISDTQANIKVVRVVTITWGRGEMIASNNALAKLQNV